MMEIHGGKAFLRLREDLEYLEYGGEGQVWRARAPFRFTCADRAISAGDILHKQVEKTDGAIRITFSGFVFRARFPGNSYCRPDPAYTPDMSIGIEMRLEGEDLVIRSSRVENIGSFRLTVSLAQGLMCLPAREKGQAVLPVDYGTRFDLPRRDVFRRVLEPSVAWSLPVHGLFTPAGGIGLWCEDPDRDYLLACNTDGQGVFSVECREHFDDMANDPRELRFMLFGPGEDFRALAKRCRELRKASGRFRTYAAKQAGNPVAEQMPGTVLWKHNVYYKNRPEGVEKTYSLYVKQAGWNENEGLPGNWTAAEVFGTAKEKGFDRVNVCNTGWNKYGFDAGYPDRLPPNPDRGTEADFAAAARSARAMSPGYFLNVHDNYIDVYENGGFFRDELLQPRPGEMCMGAVWRGGQAWWLCSACSLAYARRDLPRVRALTGPGCIYLDVFAGVPLSACRSEKHPQSRRRDLEQKRALCALARETFGALAVEGCGTDHFADLIDIGAYGGLHYSAFPPLSDGPVPVPVPLWQMVYHDSVLNYFGEGYSPVHGSEYRLYQALYTLLPTAFDAHAHRVSFGLRSAFTAQMTDFEELTPRSVRIGQDGSFVTSGAARAVYADGTQVIANFDDEACTLCGVTVPARDFVILKNGIPEEGRI